jgi:hypothetical protein
MAWHEHITLFHFPTTSVLLSLAVLGSVLAPNFHPDRLVLYLVQIFLGGSVAANHFDELVDRPWHTTMSRTRLWSVAISALSAFIAIGSYLALKVDWVFIFFVAVESFFIIAYDLEILGGIFHNANSLGISWGLVFLGGYYLQHQLLTPLVVVVSLGLCLCSMQGIVLYERGKRYGKDRQHADHDSKISWTTLRVGILSVNLVTLIMVAYRFSLLP